MKPDNETLRCPICDETDFKLMHDRVWSSQDKKVYQCEHCFVGFLHPMMTKIEEKKFYAEYNEHTQKRGVTITREPLELHKTSMPEALVRWDRLRDFFKNGGKVLEVGGSTGAFLELCSQSCDCVCVEPDPVNRKFASQFCLEQYEYIENIQNLEKFDVICLFHVFEHIRKPALFLDQCRGLLKGGGSLIIEVPHIKDPLLSIYDLTAYKDFYFQPMHPFIYSVKSLRYVFESKGFCERDIIYNQRYGLDNHLSWLQKQKPGGDPKFTEFFGKCDEYCRTLEKAQTTDTITYVAVKKG